MTTSLDSHIRMFCETLDPDIKQRWVIVMITRVIHNYIIGCGITEVELWGQQWLSNTDRSAVAAAKAETAALEAWATAWATGPAEVEWAALWVPRVAQVMGETWAVEAACATWTTVAERKQQILDILTLDK